MQLAILAGIVATFATAHSAPKLPVNQPLLKVALVVAIVVVQVGSAWIIANASHVTVRANQRSSQRRLRWLFALRRMHVALWLTGLLLIQLGLGWTRVVRHNAGLDGYLLLDELLILAPVILPLVLMWQQFARMDASLTQLQVGDAPSKRDSRNWIAARHYLLLPLLPLLLLTSVRDVSHLVAPDFANGDYGLLIPLAPVTLVVLSFPLALRWLWPTQVLAHDEVRTRLLSSASRAGVRIRDILVWNAGAGVRNAATMGYLPRLRYVLLSDALIAQLSTDELEAVFAHELGHLRRGHLTKLLVALMVPVVLGLAMVDTTVGTASSASSGLVVAACVLGYVIVVLGRYARLLEHEADLWACQHLRDGQQPPGKVGGDLPRQRYAAALTKLMADEDVKHAKDWLHPSLPARLSFLERVSRDPYLGDRFSRRLWRINTLFVVVIAALTLIGLTIG